MRSAWIALLLLTAACNTASPELLPQQQEIIDYPALNEESQRELGDTLLARGVANSRPELELHNDFLVGGGLFKEFTVPPQVLSARYHDAEWTYFPADGVMAHDELLGSDPAMGGLKRDNDDNARFQIYAHRFGLGVTPHQPIEVSSMKVPGEPQFEFMQELIYNGRYEDQVRFVYREYGGGFLRTPFTQDVQYDLTNDLVVGFKGARIRIIEATNTAIRYVVEQTFTGQELTH